jgi:ferric-dicitrate binding protein FerR (iron transport regulator)
MKKQNTYSPDSQIYSNLENFQSIDVEGDWILVKNKMDFRKTRRLGSLFQVAAILITILSFGFLAKVLILDGPEMIIVATGEEVEEIHLPDGSLIYLNSESELHYPENFRLGKRSVFMTGEGFFKISSDPDRPFLVQIADRAIVEVLGTSFNIKSKPGDMEIGVQVVEGRVAFYTPGAKDNRTILNKGDQAELQDGNIRLRAKADPNFLSWQTGILYFQQSPIHTVAEQLEAYYNRKIILDNSIPKDLTFTSTIDNQEIEDVLEELSLVLELIITYNPDTITISKQH